MSAAAGQHRVAPDSQPDTIEPIYQLEIIVPVFVDGNVVFEAERQAGGQFVFVPLVSCGLN